MPSFPVVRQAEVAIIRGRVLPRNNKYDETLLSKVSNQRVFGREIEDVILHDPCRDDQDWFGKNLFRYRLRTE